MHKTVTVLSLRDIKFCIVYLMVTGRGKGSTRWFRKNPIHHKCNYTRPVPVTLRKRQCRRSNGGEKITGFDESLSTVIWFIFIHGSRLSNTNSVLRLIGQCPLHWSQIVIRKLHCSSELLQVTRTIQATQHFELHQKVPT